MSLPPSATLDLLTDVNLADLLDAAGLSRLHGTLFGRLLRPPARRFARVAHEFDRRVGAHGLSQGSAWLMAQMTAGLRTWGAEQVPAHGPVVVLANHPGMTDTVALFCSLAHRPDLRVIALDRPFLRALPHVARQLIFLPGDASGRMAALRAGARHLQEGGALLTFPAGEIEPDPAAFGLARGALIVFVLVVLAGHTELPQEAWWREARLSGAAVAAVQQSRAVLPPALSSWLPY